MIWIITHHAYKSLWPLNPEQSDSGLAANFYFPIIACFACDILVQILHRYRWKRHSGSKENLQILTVNIFLGSCLGLCSLNLTLHRPILIKLTKKHNIPLSQVCLPHGSSISLQEPWERRPAGSDGNLHVTMAEIWYVKSEISKQLGLILVLSVHPCICL